jgi:anti-anti-sigma factor
LSSRKKGTSSLCAYSIDYRNAHDYKVTLDQLSSQRVNRLLLNLEEVEFMDSAGLSVLLYGKRLMEKQQGQLSACQVQPYVNQLFRMTRLDQVMKVYPSQYTALTLMNQAAGKKRAVSP